jgi:hypothetical protein
MPTYDEEGRPATRAPAPPLSLAQRAAVELAALEARASYAKAEFDVIAAEATRQARRARETLGAVEGSDAFERCKAAHGAAQTAFRIYRRQRLAADRARRAALFASRGEEAS